jgi:hypothetical protein
MFTHIELGFSGGSLNWLRHRVVAPDTHVGSIPTRHPILMGIIYLTPLEIKNVKIIKRLHHFSGFH